MERGPQANGSADVYRIAVDIGGTFTDLVLQDGDGALLIAKTLSTPDDVSKGVMRALHLVAGRLGVDSGHVLARCSMFVHGSTIATNTMLEHSGARVGLLVTEGFRDSLVIRRGVREDMWDHRTPFAPVLVPRYLRIGIPERIDRDGRVVTDLDREAVREAALFMKAEGVDAVAVCFLNSFAEPCHEREAGGILEETFGADAVSLSCEVAPIIGEYERSSTTVINAALAPKVVPHLVRLDRTLQEGGLGRPLHLVQSNGGAASVAQMRERPVSLLISGPAACVGALDLVARQTGHDHLISMEIGGTSCDVAMMHAGEVALTDDLMIAGYHVAVPAIDVHTVGAGGGTIASVDAGGMIKLGPQGAGAYPGPACYGQGGTRPTVTDALVVLGRLSAEAFAAGEITLVPERAAMALTRDVAEPLAITTRDAAAGVVTLLEQNLLHAVERISIERGYDPANSILVAGGGAGPMHGAAIARLVGCRTVYVPRQAGALCALGMLNTDVRHDFLRVFFGELDHIEEAEVARTYTLLDDEAVGVLADEGFAGDRVSVTRAMSLRYEGQQWSVRIRAPRFRRDELRATFEEAHQRMYGHIQPGGTLEITSLHVTGRGVVPRIVVADDRRQGIRPDPVTRRPVFADASHGVLDTPVYQADSLAPGMVLDGPLLIEEATTTIHVGPRDRVTIDRFGNYLISLEP